MPKTLRGQCLIAAKHLRDKNFYKTLVLLVEHGEEGAMGLVLNRPTDLQVRVALSEHFRLPEQGESVFCGGPVEPQALFVLHNQTDLAEDESPLAKDFYLASSAEVFSNVMQRAAEEKSGLQFRVYAGCAGWGPRQLDGELENGDWHLLNAHHSFVFAEDSYSIYETALSQVLIEKQILPPTDFNPGLN